MGRLRKRGGKWQIRYYRNGKRHEEITGTADRDAAKRLLKLREGDVAKGLAVTPLAARYTFEQAALNVRREYAANERQTGAWVERRLRLPLLPAFERRRMSTISTSDVRAYVHSRLSANAANATINREVALLKRMFSLALKDGTVSFAS